MRAGETTRILERKIPFKWFPQAERIWRMVQVNGLALDTKYPNEYTQKHLHRLRGPVECLATDVLVDIRPFSITELRSLARKTLRVPISVDLCEMMAPGWSRIWWYSAMCPRWAIAGWSYVRDLEYLLAPRISVPKFEYWAHEQQLTRITKADLTGPRGRPMCQSIDITSITELGGLDPRFLEAVEDSP
jgi:hypothetical protein